jgi:hypothetical protein
MNPALAAEGTIPVIKLPSAAKARFLVVNTYGLMLAAARQPVPFRRE